MTLREAVPRQRLRWAGHARILASGNGTIFHNEGRLVMSNTVLDSWAAEVAPKLTGEFTIHEIAAGFPEEQRARVVTLVNALVAEGLIDVEDYGPLFRSQFRYQLDLLAHLGTEPAKAFLNFRCSRVLIAGTGVALDLCAAALLKSGLEHISVAPLQPGNRLEITQSTTCELCAMGMNAGFSLASCNVELNGFDLVAYCSDRPRLSDILKLNRKATRARKPFLPGFAFEEWIILGPVLARGHCGCWLCGLRRILPLVPGFPTDAGFLLRNELAATQAENTVARELATDTAFAIFKALAGNVRPELGQAMLFQKRRDEVNFDAMLPPQPLCACMGYCMRYTV